MHWLFLHTLEPPFRNVTLVAEAWRGGVVEPRKDKTQELSDHKDKRWWKITLRASQWEGKGGLGQTKPQRDSVHSWGLQRERQAEGAESESLSRGWEEGSRHDGWVTRTGRFGLKHAELERRALDQAPSRGHVKAGVDIWEHWPWWKRSVSQTQL